jgi:excisionase family DNA binding protein
VTSPVVASVVATAGQTRSAFDVHGGPTPHLRVLSPSGGRRPKQVNAMTATTGLTTGTTRLTAVAPTPTGVIRAVEERLDALERHVRATREALAVAEAELLAAHQSAETPPEALTTDQVARQLGLSRSTVATMIGRGQLASVKIGAARRVLRRDLDAYLTALPSGGAA